MKLNISDEQSVGLLHWIFERELKPPFRKDQQNIDKFFDYYNRNDEYIGWLHPYDIFLIHYSNFDDIIRKVCQAFGIDSTQNTEDLHDEVRSHLKLWLGDQINVKLVGIH